jgi:hypothetical protein
MHYIVIARKNWNASTDNFGLTSTMTEKRLQPDSNKGKAVEEAKDNQENKASRAWLDETRDAPGGAGGKRTGAADAKREIDPRAAKVAGLIAEAAAKGPITEKAFFGAHSELSAALGSTKHLTDMDRMRSFQRFVNDVNTALAACKCTYRFLENALSEGNLGTRLDLCNINRNVMIDGLPLKQVVHSKEYIVKKAEE